MNAVIDAMEAERAALRAQRHAAMIVREMRDQAATLQPHVERIAKLNRGLEVLLDDLSPAQAQAIKAEVAKVAEVIASLLNPAGESA